DDASANIVRESPSLADAETGADIDRTNSRGETEILQIDEEQRKDVDNQVNLEEKTTELDQGQAGSDPGKTPESGLHGHHSYLSSVFLSSTTITLVIDLSPPKLVSPTTQAPIFIATTITTTTTLPLPPPLQQQSTTDSELVARVTTLEKKFADFEQKSQTLENTTQNLGSRVFTFELHDMPHKINQTVNKVVKEVVHIAFKALLRDRFRELPEADRKEILHQRMFESGSYKSLPGHISLYEALKASMERANRDKFFDEKDKSRKRRHDDQDPPHLPPDSNPSKKRRHDSDASGSFQPQAPQSSAQKTSDTSEAPLSSSKQQSGPSSEQPVKDVPMPDTALMSDSQDTYSAYLPKIKPRPEWLNPILKEDRPATPEPD
nr:hypothetical protein [Tanacetum cinerariifolium]